MMHGKKILAALSAALIITGAASGCSLLKSGETAGESTADGSASSVETTAPLSSRDAEAEAEKVFDAYISVQDVPKACKEQIKYLTTSVRVSDNEFTVTITGEMPNLQNAALLVASDRNAMGGIYSGQVLKVIKGQTITEDDGKEAEKLFEKAVEEKIPDASKTSFSVKVKVQRNEAGEISADPEGLPAMKMPELTDDLYTDEAALCAVKILYDGGQISEDEYETVAGRSSDIRSDIILTRYSDHSDFFDAYAKAYSDRVEVVVMPLTFYEAGTSFRYTVIRSGATLRDGSADIEEGRGDEMKIDLPLEDGIYEIRVSNVDGTEELADIYVRIGPYAHERRSEAGTGDNMTFSEGRGLRIWDCTLGKDESGNGIIADITLYDRYDPSTVFYYEIWRDGQFVAEKTYTTGGSKSDRVTLVYTPEKDEEGSVTMVLFDPKDDTVIGEFYGLISSEPSEE